MFPNSGSPYFVNTGKLKPGTGRLESFGGAQMESLLGAKASGDRVLAKRIGSIWFDRPDDVFLPKLGGAATIYDRAIAYFGDLEWQELGQSGERDDDTFELILFPDEYFVIIVGEPYPRDGSPWTRNKDGTFGSYWSATGSQPIGGKSYYTFVVTKIKSLFRQPYVVLNCDLSLGGYGSGSGAEGITIDGLRDNFSFVSEGVFEANEEYIVPLPEVSDPLPVENPAGKANLLILNTTWAAYQARFGL